MGLSLFGYKIFKRNNMNKMKYTLLTLVFSICMGTAMLSQGSLQDRIENYMMLWEDQGFSGSVLVAYQGEIILEEGYGFADRSANIKNTAETVFDIGSITKQFTATGILKLAMYDKLKVQDKLSKYFKDVPKDKEAITLHHLLSHSAGFPGGIGNDYTAISEEDFIQKALASSLKFEPGTDYNYSNVGYSLLALIIEKVSGLTYEQYLKKNLFEPSGMDQTGYVMPDWDSDKIATGYRNNKEWGKPNEKKWDKDGPYLHLKGNGGILSTVGDMYKWHQALLDDKILDTKSKEMMYTKHVQEGEGAQSYYGYGWAIFPTSRNTELIAHNGGNGVFFADFWRYLDEETIIITMSNQANRSTEVIPSHIAKMTREKDFVPEVSSQENDHDSDMDQLEGLVDVIFATFTEGTESSFDQLLDTHCTRDFRDFVSRKEHYEMMSSIHKKIKGGEIATVDLQQGSIVLGISSVLDKVQMNIGYEMVDGKPKVAGLQVE